LSTQPTQPPCEEFAAEEKLKNAEVEKEEENEFLCEKRRRITRIENLQSACSIYFFLFSYFSQST
jgi:hypothetical protein